MNDERRAGDARDEAWSSETALRRLVMYVLLPGWFVPGVLDWWWHRRTRIEDTAGARESLIHSLMMLEVGLPIVASLFLEIDAGVLAVMGATLVAHELTAMWDVAYATPRRPVAPREQHTHSFLEVLPFAAAGIAAALHPQQARALFGSGPEKPDLRFRLKTTPLPRRYVITLLTAIGLFIVLPYGEEFLRCLRVRPTLKRAEVPENAPLQPLMTQVRESGAEGFE